MDANSSLAATLHNLAPLLDGAGCRWVIIGSAAVAMHTGDATGIGDVDVLIDEADAATAFAALNLPLCPGAGDERFRSRWFGTWLSAPLPVELFSGFEVRSDGPWRPVHLKTRIEREFGGARGYIPGAGELHDLLLSFGREKDLIRAARLNPSAPSPSRSESA